MQSPLFNWKTRLGVILAVAAVVVTYRFATTETAVQCSTIPCSYFEHGRMERGTCGSNKADINECYCFKKDNGTVDGSATAPPQRQVGCRK